MDLAHGRDPPLIQDEPQIQFSRNFALSEPRWITALAVIPYSDLVLSGSWDGYIRAWRVSEDRRKLTPVRILGQELREKVSIDPLLEDATEDSKRFPEPPRRGLVNDIAVIDGGNSGISVVVALAKEHRLGRWKTVPGKNGAMMFEIPYSVLRESMTEAPNVLWGTGQKRVCDLSATVDNAMYRKRSCHRRSLGG